MTGHTPQLSYQRTSLQGPRGSRWVLAASAGSLFQGPRRNEYFGWRVKKVAAGAPGNRRPYRDPEGSKHDPVGQQQPDRSPGNVLKREVGSDGQHRQGMSVYPDILFSPPVNARETPPD